MQHTLHPSRRVAACGRDLVFLDLRHGVYDLMAGAGEVAHVRSCGQALSIGDPDLETALLGRGWLLTTPSYLDAPPLPTLPTRSALTLNDQAWGSDLWVRWGLARLSMVGHRALPFSKLIRRRDRRMESVGEDRLSQLARGFDERLPWVPVQGDCLFRCLMLLRMMTAAERDKVKWVFAVKTWPFHAHCWLQTGDIALTDHFEPLLGFRPIFAA